MAHQLLELNEVQKLILSHLEVIPPEDVQEYLMAILEGVSVLHNKALANLEVES
jgi:hypothetical protein